MGGRADTLLALSRIYQHLAAANFEPEGETAGRLPWHRWDPDGPRQKGDGCARSIGHRGPTTTHRLEKQTLATFCRFVKVSPSISRSTLLPQGNNVLPVWERISGIQRFTVVSFKGHWGG